jgi:hypothetical protein
MKRNVKNLTILGVVFVFLSMYVFAAGGGGGGSSSSGLGFSNARESIFILVNGDYSSKFSLKNGTKYDLEVDIEESKVDLKFSSLSLNPEEGDNFVDLNNDGFADINFKIESAQGRRADLRIIDVKDKVPVTTKETAVENDNEYENAVEEEEDEHYEIYCSELDTVRERISCRLDLEEEDQEEELEVYFLPEECRAVYFTPREECLERYESVQGCWQFPVGNERILCVKKVMNLGTIQEEKEKCSRLGGVQKLVCEDELKNKVYNLIKWRFYDLEERAEDFMHRNLIDKETATDFIITAEESKVKFNEVKAFEEKKNIILNVRIAWNDLMRDINSKGNIVRIGR